MPFFAFGLAVRSDSIETVSVTLQFFEHPVSCKFLLLSFSSLSVDDVYAVSDKLEKAGCDFQKKPDEGGLQ